MLRTAQATATSAQIAPVNLRGVEPVTLEQSEDDVKAAWGSVQREVFATAGLNGDSEKNQGTWI